MIAAEVVIGGATLVVVIDVSVITDDVVICGTTLVVA